MLKSLWSARRPLSRAILPVGTQGLIKRGQTFMYMACRGKWGFDKAGALTIMAWPFDGGLCNGGDMKTARRLMPLDCKAWDGGAVGDCLQEIAAGCQLHT